MFLQNICKHLPACLVSHTRKQESSFDCLYSYNQAQRFSYQTSRRFSKYHVWFPSSYQHQLELSSRMVNQGSISGYGPITTRFKNVQWPI
jgi:hypothetical protein